MDAIPPDVYERREVTARKPHYCCSCNYKGTSHRIKPGDKYFLHKGLWDGEWRTYKRCRRCEAVDEALFKELPYDYLLALNDVRNELRRRLYERNRNNDT